MSRMGKLRCRVIVWIMLLMLVGKAMPSLVATPAAGQAPGEESRSQAGRTSLKDYDCTSCHAEDHAIVGPAFIEIAKRYAGKPGATDTLTASIRNGEAGLWGSATMPAHPGISDAQLRTLVLWILSLNTAQTDAAPTPAKKYTYTLESGKTVTLDFPLFLEGQARKVNKDVFRGYELYNSYCYRCHGTDATDSELAPSLRDSLAKGMTIQQMTAICMTGREDKGMPAWAGFLNEQDVKDIFMYVEGRRLDLIPIGRPPSAD